MLNIRTYMSAFLLLCVLTSIPVHAAETNIDSVAVYQRAGGQFLTRGEFKSALDEYLKALRLDPDSPRTLEQLGTVYTHLGNYQKAISSLQRAHQLSPGDPDVCNNLGAAYSHRGDRTRAIELYEEAVALDSTDALYRFNLGQEYARTGRIGMALPQLRRAMALDSTRVVVMYTLGNCFAKTNILDSAEYYYDTCYASGHHTPSLLYFRGTVKRDLGKTDEARKSFLEALALSPAHKLCLQDLGALYLQEENYPAAIEQFHRAVAADSEFYQAWVGLGAAYALDRQDIEADRVLTRLIAVDSSLAAQMMEYVYSVRKQEAVPGEEP